MGFMEASCGSDEGGRAAEGGGDPAESVRFAAALFPSFRHRRLP
jgi:hypothetical protein